MTWTEERVTLEPERSLRIRRRGSGPVAIWSHGAFMPMDVEDSTVVRPVLEAIEGWSLVRYDSRGEGASTAAHDHRYSVDAGAEDVLRLADVIGAERFLVGGLSRGALVSLEVARRAPERIFGILLVAPASTDALSAVLPPGEVQRFMAVTREMIVNVPAPEAIRQIWRATCDNIETMDAEHVDRMMRGWAQSGYQLDREALAAHDLPLHAWAAKGDPGHPYALAEGLVNMMQRGSISTIEDIDDPLSSAAALLAFLDDVRGAVA